MTTLESGITILEKGDLIIDRYEVEGYAHFPDDELKQTQECAVASEKTEQWHPLHDTVVLKAYDRKAQTHVGMKAFVGESLEAQQKAKQEAEVHRRLSQRAGGLVVPIMDVRQLAIYGDIKQPTIVTDWAKYGTYDTFEARTDEEIEEVLRLTVRVAGALAILADDGLVHADVRPGNIARSRDGAKLMDFGSVIKSGEKHEKTVGTEGYVPIETLETGISTSKRDTFALCASVVRMLTGEMPYDTKRMAKQMAKEAYGYPVRNLDKKLHMLPTEAVDTLRRGLSPDEYVRPNAREIAADIGRLLV